MSAPSRREPGLAWSALWRMALCGAVFVVVYGGCNRFTSTRSDVGVYMFSWERHIPFVREMVIPYWSLDLFFCGAFFLCASRAKLNLLTLRLVAVTLASGACFLLFPLKAGLPRPVPEGWTAPLFTLLYQNDMPYNMAPSLHISLRSLVWIVYGAHLTGWTRKVAKVWFILIGLSTLLVWQHHLVDVATGFLMGWLVAAVIRDRETVEAPTPSARLAKRYGAGAVACAGLSFGWIGFAWPAAACGIMALAYAIGRASLLGKENGTLSPSAEWCLLPVIVVRWIVQRKWLARVPGWREVAPGVWVGRKPTRREAELLVKDGPLSVLDLTSESNAPVAFRERAVYHNIPMLDLVAPHPLKLDAAATFITEQLAAGRRVFIHCQLGIERSVKTVEYWLGTQVPP